MREGEGEMMWSDGSHYRGDWKRGIPNGLGIFVLIKELSK